MKMYPQTMPLVALPSQMISAYFEQTDQYFSESGGVFVQVKDMHPTYAANAAARLLDYATTWAKDAGAADWDSRPKVWMIRRPLFLALVARANS
jgi:hypothetical protein